MPLLLVRGCLEPTTYLSGVSTLVKDARVAWEEPTVTVGQNRSTECLTHGAPLGAQPISTEQP